MANLDANTISSAAALAAVGRTGRPEFAPGFRSRLRPFLVGDGSGPRPAGGVEVDDRVEIARETEHSGTVVARRNVVIGEAARVNDVYAGGDAVVAAAARIGALACDGLLVLSPGCRVERWVDAANISVAHGCNLGQSASAIESLRIAHDCVFTRLWGMPIETLDNGRVNAYRRGEGIRAPAEVVPTRGTLTLRAETHMAQDVVANAGVDLGIASTIEGSVQAHGSVVVGAGSRVAGDVVARGDVRIGSDATVLGNVFAEGHVHLAPGARIGSRRKAASVYASREITIAPTVFVVGWVSAGRGGRVVG